LSEVWTLSFSPDGRTLISGSKDGDVKLWPAHAQRTEDVITGVRHPLAFSTDGRTLAGVTRDRSAVVFLDLATSEMPQQFPLENRRGRFGALFPSAAVSDDLRTLAHAQDDGTVKLWNTSTHDATTLKVSDGPAELLALSPDGRVLITRGRDWTLRKWDLRSGTNTAWPTDAFRVLFSRDGRLLATVGRGDEVQLWDATTLAPQVKLKSDEPPAMGLEFTAAFSADGHVLAVACQDDAIRLWDTATGQLLGACTGHKQGVRSVAFAPDGKTLATTSDDSTLKFWNTATQQELLTIRQLGATLTGLTFSPDGRLLVGGSGAFSKTGGPKTGGLRFFRAPPLNEIDAAQAVPVQRAELP
jgi:WD40 repeat protein